MPRFTAYPNGVSSFGIPITGNGYSMDFGNKYFVDGTNGSNSNKGDTPTTAYKTIQTAVTQQIADATGLGDVIYVMPGMYPESIVGNLTKVKLIGYHPFATRVQPTASHAFSGNLHDAVVSGFCFDSPSSSSTDYAAFRCTTVEDSVIDGNQFCCRVNVANSVGVMIGTYATASTTVKFHRSKFINNQILANGGNQVFDYGFVWGSGSADATNANARTGWNSLIAGNVISAEHQGIRLISNYAGSYGTVIRDNIITGDAANHGETDQEGIYFLDDTNSTKLARIWVVNNRISSDSDAIKGFTVQLTQGNIAGVGGVGTVTPVGESGYDA